MVDHITVSAKVYADILIKYNFYFIIIIIIYLNCKWVSTRWQCTTIRHITQITHYTQTNTAHKTTQTNKNTPHTMKDTTHNELQQIQIQQLNELILIKISILYIKH
jgi:hypothetical protein